MPASERQNLLPYCQKCLVLPRQPHHILSAMRMKSRRYILDWKDGGIKNQIGNEVAVTYEEDGIVLVRTVTADSYMVLATGPLPVKKVSAEKLHRMMEHMGYSNLKKFMKNSTGLKLEGHASIHSTCTCCLKSKLRKRPFAERQHAERKGKIFYLDLVPTIKPEGYN